MTDVGPDGILTKEAIEKIFNEFEKRLFLAPNNEKPDLVMFEPIEYGKKIAEAQQATTEARQRGLEEEKVRKILSKAYGLAPIKRMGEAPQVVSIVAVDQLAHEICNLFVDIEQVKREEKDRIIKFLDGANDLQELNIRLALIIEEEK